HGHSEARNDETARGREKADDVAPFEACGRDRRRARGRRDRVLGQQVMAPRLRFKISMSIDGYVAGPSQSVTDPIGVGGMRLHEWVFPLAAWRRMNGEAGGERDASNTVVEESLVNIGATIMGRNMFGGHPGPWKQSEPWNGWWGANPPFHHPVFVLTHHNREPLRLEGGTTFTFASEGIEAALEQRAPAP